MLPLSGPQVSQHSCNQLTSWLPEELRKQPVITRLRGRRPPASLHSWFYSVWPRKKKTRAVSVDRSFKMRAWHYHSRKKKTKTRRCVGLFSHKRRPAWVSWLEVRMAAAGSAASPHRKSRLARSHQRPGRRRFKLGCFFFWASAGTSNLPVCLCAGR